MNILPWLVLLLWAALFRFTYPTWIGQYIFILKSLDCLCERELALSGRNSALAEDW